MVARSGIARQGRGLGRIGRVVLLAAAGVWSVGLTVAHAQKMASDGTNATAARVAASAEQARPLGAGATLPDVTVETTDGKAVSLRDVVSKQPTVLVFYRGHWCPFCNRQLAELEKIVAPLQVMGYHLVAVSPDTPAWAAKTIAAHQLTYTVLADPKYAAIEACGLAFKSGSEEYPILPVPTVYIVRGGKIVFVHADPDFRVRMSNEDVLKQARAAAEAK